MQLTKHFSEEEMRVSFQDTRIIKNYKFLCENLLESIRAKYNEIVFITSGFRNTEHNASAGGKSTSYHLAEGGRAAADFFINNVSIVAVFDWIRLESGLKFDKVILENKNGVPVIVHLQVDRLTIPRRLAYIGATGDSQKYTPMKVV